MSKPVTEVFILLPLGLFFLLLFANNIRNGQGFTFLPLRTSVLFGVAWIVMVTAFILLGLNTNSYDDDPTFYWILGSFSSFLSGIFIGFTLSHSIAVATGRAEN